MEEKKVYTGTVRTRRGKGVGLMSPPDVLVGIRQFWGMAIIPGTLNLLLAEPFDLSLLDYATLAETGMPDVDSATLAAMGIDFDGEIGLHWARVVIADRYPGGLCCPTWVPRPVTMVELVSPHHLRTALNLKDGDAVEFRLA